MMTPKQEILWTKISSNPTIKNLITKLDLIPIQSPEYIRSRAISARVTDIYSSFTSTLVRPRTIVQDPLTDPFNLNDTINQYLLAFLGPKPWTYPLTKSPF